MASFIRKVEKYHCFTTFPSPLPYCWQALNWTYVLPFKGKRISHHTFLESRGFFGTVKADLKETSWNLLFQTNINQQLKPSLSFHFWDLPSYPPYWILWNIFPNLHLKSWQFFPGFSIKLVFPKHSCNPAFPKSLLSFKTGLYTHSPGPTSWGLSPWSFLRVCSQLWAGPSWLCLCSLCLELPGETQRQEQKPSISNSLAIFEVHIPFSRELFFLPLHPYFQTESAFKSPL